MTPDQKPPQLNSPNRREYSIFGQRFMTTRRPAASAREAASSLRTPICIHTAFAPAAMASSVIGPAAAELRNTSTRSGVSPSASSDPATGMPRISPPASRGLTGSTR